ncbi:hypothetical protein KY092_07840 [Natronomonas gomsonensis]|uniref:hypothetical protein n=1 Tax=Natronomonas gomsonensis TaxID=1046043 RepID=UPI0020CA8668|nr:hypothetical protein [Natronomonas gomsonensis]MCY4730467.1 hypothetical protein [Natronomonas gomsonensis]
MKKERLKGFFVAKLNNSLFHDRDSFVQKTEDHLEAVKVEADIEECVEELIEEGWIEYIEEGDNLKQVVPESERKQKTLPAGGSQQ